MSENAIWLPRGIWSQFQTRHYNKLNYLIQKLKNRKNRYFDIARHLGATGTIALHCSHRYKRLNDCPWKKRSRNCDSPECAGVSHLPNLLTKLDFVRSGNARSGPLWDTTVRTAVAIATPVTLLLWLRPLLSLTPVIGGSRSDTRITKIL